ncbi:ribosomal RNA methyltransferase FtsJ domain-containing protein [Copromyces sp. CBS 386.78]|nr:ribosomal RNA methyltransferase FtsJ domain-containing protein [Copromyces sp. CBS 386.78]
MLPRRLPPGLRLRSRPLTSTLPPTINTTRTSQFLTTNPTTPQTLQTRLSSSSSSSSSSRWKARQSSDPYARSARTAHLKSRAAFKLLEINKKYRLFRRASGQIVVDLGFAPGSWSQVALDLTKPDGKVVGIDIIPAQPPRGVSAIQGNFLSEGVRGIVKGWLREEEGRRRGEQLREMARKEAQREAEVARLEKERLEAEEREAREREAEERREREEEEGRREWGLETKTETGREVEDRGEVVNEGEGKLKKKDAEMVEDIAEEMDKLEITDRWQGELLDRQQHKEPNTWEMEVLRRQQERQERQERKGAEEQVVFADRPSYIELERMAVREAQVMQQPEVMEQEQDQDSENKATTTTDADAERKSDSEERFEELEGEEEEEEQQQQPKKKKQNEQMRLVDVVLSDMSEPWPQTSGFSLKTMSNPYNRMMNTSGISFKDHAGSMDLCYAALSFANDTLKPGGHFVCKFYQGSEDKELEAMLKKLFTKVYRDKPDSSRSESKEAYFVALNRRGDVILEDIPL